MYVDNNLTLSGSITNGVVTGQTVTGAASVISTNTIDMVKAGDLGEGMEIYGRAQITTTFTGLTALEIQVIAANDAALSTGVTVVGSSGAIPVAQLTAGARFAAAINPRLANNGQRYYGLRYVPTGTGTAGALFGDIGIEVQDGQKFYPSGFVVA